MVILEYIWSFLVSSWSTLREMSPYLLFGFLVAGILSVLVRPESVERHLGGRGVLQIVKAALFGVPLPLCSCGVIPVSASLRKHGASSGATTSFLISTPQTGADSILVTLSLLGPVFAIVRPVVSFVSGLLGGALVLGFGEKEMDKEENRPVCHADCCTGTGEKKSGFIQVLRYGFRTLPEDLYKALIIGIMIAGLISAIIPEDYFAPVLGGGILSLLILMAAGIPVYVCATASVPIAAALIAKGVSPGAALVFLMTGPATNAATISTVWKIMGKRTALIYLGTVAVSALAAGLMMDYVLITGSVGISSSMPWMIPGQVKTACAVILLVVLASAAMARPEHHHEEGKEGESRMKVRISGMTCHHCSGAVRSALLENSNIETAVVDHKKGTAVITGRGFDIDQLKRIIEDAGYRFEDAEEINNL
ncbi:MAG: SO_0444 family Cu/Zn efflux transporter [Candidatus Latescibacteria bacterium]|nr:SO_0444 family Cu/Zn efflux transporter [bacterium]MBD3425179.1 SO_0444 family Cu/Zn efflux transporter [Candidatus Latescibacterota bacterium]